MTKEEAITALGDRNNLLWGMSKEEQKYYSEALNMAISALKGFEGMTYHEIISQFLPQGAYLSADKNGRIHIRGVNEERLNTLYEKGDKPND